MIDGMIFLAKGASLLAEVFIVSRLFGEPL